MDSVDLLYLGVADSVFTAHAPGQQGPRTDSLRCKNSTAAQAVFGPEHRDEQRRFFGIVTRRVRVHRTDARFRSKMSICASSRRSSSSGTP